MTSKILTDKHKREELKKCFEKAQYCFSKELKHQFKRKIALKLEESEANLPEPPPKKAKFPCDFTLNCETTPDLRKVTEAEIVIEEKNYDFIEAYDYDLQKLLKDEELWERVNYQFDNTSF